MVIYLSEMKSYTKVYLQFFGLTTADFIPCEVCGMRSVDIHHIKARSLHSKLLNEIKNLMALCRVCHDRYGDRIGDLDFLQQIHDEKMKEA